MAEDLAIAFSAISLMLWVMLWLLGIVKGMLPIHDRQAERNRLIVPGLLYGGAVLIGFSVIMFVGFIIVPRAGSVLLANIGIALLVVQTIIIFVAPYIVGINSKDYRQVSSRALISAHIVGTFWLLWLALLMRLLINTLTIHITFNMASLLGTLVISILVVLISYLEFMWITAPRLNVQSKADTCPLEPPQDDTSIDN